MRILVAIDGSQYAEEVIEGVTRFFKAQKTEVRILHVLMPALVEAPPQMAPGYAPELTDEGNQARAMVDKYAQRLRLEGHKVDAFVEVGDVRESILDSADAWHADVILVGSHGHRSMARLLLGSVAESVARQANCSVLVVRPLASK